MKKRWISLLLALVIVFGMTVPAAAAPGFSDLKQRDWYYQEVLQMVNAGILSGYPDGSFRGEASMTVAEFVTVLSKMLGKECGATEEHWAGVQMKAAKKSKWLNEDDLAYAPQDTPLPRQLAAKILVKALDIRNNGKTDNLIFRDRDQIREDYVTYVATAYENGLFKGDENGNFDPNGTIIRGAAATLVWRAQGNTTAPLTGREARWKTLVDKYGKQEIIKYFLNINCHAYKSTDPNKLVEAKLTQWKKPIYYYVSGSYSLELMEALRNIANQMNQIEGFPGISQVFQKSDSNVTIEILSDYEMSMMTYEHYGYVESSYIAILQHSVQNFTNNKGEIFVGTSELNNAGPQLVARLLFMMGGMMYDEQYTYPDSLFYYDETVYTPSDLDWLLMELQYAEEMRSKMNREQCEKVLNRILPN